MLLAPTSTPKTYSVVASSALKQLRLSHQPHVQPDSHATARTGVVLTAVHPRRCLATVATPEQRSFQLTEEQYMEKMDGVSYRLNVLGQTTLVRSFLQQPARAKGGLPKRPVMGTAVRLSRPWAWHSVHLCIACLLTHISAHPIRNKLFVSAPEG